MSAIQIVLYGMAALASIEMVWIGGFLMAQFLLSQKDPPALFRCTKCGGTEYKPVRHIWLTAILVYILRCSNCSKNFYLSIGESDNF